MQKIKKKKKIVMKNLKKIFSRAFKMFKYNIIVAA